MVSELSLITNRLQLRDFVEADWADVHAFRADPEVARFVDDLTPERPEQSRAWLDEVIAHNRQRPRVAYNLAIVQRAENRVVGWVGIGDSERYPTVGELGFGYVLNRAYWGQGYATEAARAIVEFGFARLGGQRISAWCYAENHASARVLEKAGMRLARRYDHTDPRSGQVRPCLEYAIRVEEWRASARG